MSISEKEFIEKITDYKQYLYKMAFLYVKDENSALEIIDETVFKAYLSYKKLRKSEHFKTWITKILINCAIDYLRDKKKICGSIDEADIKIEEKEYVDLYNGINLLTGIQKTIIILKYFYDFTIKEIAEILSISDSSVKNNLHKALEFLRIQLKEE
ncbi:RNA polymerase sigma-70 factor, ECF subfamily [Caloramator quimbayensis]|uniref:RNA polymerase sigma-70 factor, ECF subfamily n=1 Tax=Caloramator quimbayensis TaxID=1147123 RepID=A0A1T4XED0_9CLOT|nr:sigma-70 family RNA polymerase sigma factor [Caloramator quimbayensis]SKA87767.1 RNA polymerase sigma-70 factor, ECF subfamily [Caloramator quimbayensis]